MQVSSNEAQNYSFPSLNHFPSEKLQLLVQKLFSFRKAPAASTKALFLQKSSSCWYKSSFPSEKLQLLVQKLFSFRKAPAAGTKALFLQKSSSCWYKSSFPSEKLQLLVQKLQLLVQKTQP